MVNIDFNFLIGCAGAFAPEALRLYNLRTQKTTLSFSWKYLAYLIPFILVGGFIAWILEPTSKWAAFYSGLTAPVLLTTVMKDTAKAQKELDKIEGELNKSRQKENQLFEENQKMRKIIDDLRKSMNAESQVSLTALKSLSYEENTIDNSQETQPTRHKKIGLGWLLFGITIYTVILVALFYFYESQKSAAKEVVGGIMSFNMWGIILLTVVGIILLIIVIKLLKRLSKKRDFQEFINGL